MTPLQNRLAAQHARWYDLKEIPEQRRLIDDRHRFRVIAAGRRSGKTERFKRRLAKQAMLNPNHLYFAAAPTHAQAKRIFWKDLKQLTLSATHPKRPSESELIIFMPNGTEVHVLGLDKPERFEGQPWDGGGIDEIANIKAGAWEENIMPALDTENPQRPDVRAWCWLFGVPDGLNHYYDLAQYAQAANDPDWSFYHWTSAEVLSPEAIASAMRRMSARQFRQEYEASFETASGRIYEDYDDANHTDAEIQPHEKLIWTHDQNYTPLSSAIAVEREIETNGEKETGVFFLDEIVLTSAVSRQSAMEFVDRFKDHENKRVDLHGDPAGRAGEKHGHASDYTELEDVLKDAGWTVTRKVQRKHPAIKDRQNAVRARICAADGTRRLFVNAAKAKMLDKGFRTVQLKQGSTFQEDDTNEAQHITTAAGYYIHREFPITDGAGGGLNVRL